MLNTHVSRLLVWMDLGFSLLAKGNDTYLQHREKVSIHAGEIHLFYLPPHTSHILQPLDVVLFQPFKHYHGKVVNYTTCTGCSDFNKLEFLAVISSIRQQTFKKNSILSSF
jgi:hypothetical protein